MHPSVQSTSHIAETLLNAAAQHGYNVDPSRCQAIAAEIIAGDFGTTAAETAEGSLQATAKMDTLRREVQELSDRLLATLAAGVISESDDLTAATCDLVPNVRQMQPLEAARVYALTFEERYQIPTDVQWRFFDTQIEAEGFEGGEEHAYHLSVIEDYLGTLLSTSVRGTLDQYGFQSLRNSEGSQGAFLAASLKYINENHVAAEPLSAESLNAN